MALLLTEADVRAILTMPLAMELVEESFRRLADGTAVSHPRRRLRLAEKGLMHYMAASDAQGGYVGLKIYTVSPSGLRFLVPLFSGHSGELLALIEANYLGQMRTGAASGVATRVLAREDARMAAMIGTGLQARTQLEAVALARKLELVRAYGRDAETARGLCEGDERANGRARGCGRFGRRSGARRGYRDHDDKRHQARDRGRWLERGTHVNAAGVKFRREGRDRCRGGASRGRDRGGFRGAIEDGGWRSDSGVWRRHEEMGDSSRAFGNHRREDSGANEPGPDHAVQVERDCDRGHRGCGAGVRAGAGEENGAGSSDV